MAAKRKKPDQTQTYKNIAAGLVEFGYPDVTWKMIKEIHEAIVRGDQKLPHGVIGIMVKSMHDDARGERRSRVKKC